MNLYPSAVGVSERRGALTASGSKIFQSKNGKSKMQCMDTEIERAKPTPEEGKKEKQKGEKDRTV